MDISHIFRAYDIRGIVNIDLTPEVILKTSTIFANLIKDRGGDTVLVSGDIRNSTPTLLFSAISGILNAGIDAILSYPLPIPVFGFYVWSNKNIHGGAFITASHNPPEYNGIRFRHDDGTGFSKENRIIRDRFLNGEIEAVSWDKLGNFKALNNDDIFNAYISFVEKKIPTPEKTLKIILDGMYGTANLIVHTLFNRMKHKVISMHAIPNGTFPIGMPDPLHGDTSEIRESMKSLNADLGVAYDGDGDRAAFFDAKGRLIPAEIIGLYLAEKLLKPNDIIIYNVMCSSIIKYKAEELGFKTVESKVGDVFVAEEAKKHNAKLGIEESYHFFLPLYGFYYDDSIMTSILVANLLAEDNLDGVKLYERYGPIYTLRENIRVKEEEKFSIIEKFEKWAKQNFAEVSTIDGVKIYLENGSFLARPSNTEPLIRVVADADSEEKAKEILSTFTKKLKEFMD